MIGIKDLNDRLLKTQYAVRGPIVARALELEKQGRKIIYCNIGNPQALKQKPITFLRQLLAVLEYPGLAEKVKDIFPLDVLGRAETILAENPHGLGAYTQSEGMPFIRKAVAGFIQERDGISADENRIMLTDGASKGVQLVFTALMKNENDGFMIPVPQYPLYSATIDLYGARRIDYYLDESSDWELNRAELEFSVEEARKAGINPVAMAVINPGNPTGAVLSEENMKMIVNFAAENGIALMADEVYQENIYAGSVRFRSFAGIMDEMGEKDVPLFSFHSVSKGFLGECGHRGGYIESRNIPDEVYAQFVKLQSVGLCANTAGQIATYAMVSPPREGDDSFELYVEEKNRILTDLREKAEILGREFGHAEGMSLSAPEGAMYAFVRVDIPVPDSVRGMPPRRKAEYEAKLNSDYCMNLLEDTGICVVPGSGFGQKPGTFHFRTTFLPPKEDIAALAEKIKKFHVSYTEKIRKNPLPL